MELAFTRLLADLDAAERCTLPADPKAVEKLKCPITQGCRIWWYCRDAAKFWREEKVEPRDHTSDTGIVVCKPDAEYRGGELDLEDCVVVQDGYQCEKCYPEVGWIALARLLDDNDVVEVFSK